MVPIIMTRAQMATAFRAIKRKERKSLQKMCEDMDIDYQTLWRYLNPDKFPTTSFRERIKKAIHTYLLERHQLWQKE